jgi:hypothetical protein
MKGRLRREEIEQHGRKEPKDVCWGMWEGFGFRLECTWGRRKSWMRMQMSVCLMQAYE